MKNRVLIIIGMILLPMGIGSVYAECSEKDRDACIGSDGKFDYDAYEDSFWEPVKIQHSFEKNSTATFEHKKEGLGLRGIFTATQEDVVMMTVPRSLVDSIHRNCDPDEIMLLAKYEKQYGNTTFHKGFYQESFLADQIMNQTHRIVTLKVLPTMSFEFLGSFPLGLVGDMLDTCGAPNGYLTYYAPPKFQLEKDVDPKLIKCNEGLVLVQKNNDASACVKESTVPKLVERGWTKDKAVPTFDYVIEYDGVTYGSQYEITGGTVNEITYDAHSNSLIISLNESKKGYIIIVIQTGLLHSLDQLPFTYFVIADGEEVLFEQLSPIVLKIPFEKDTKEIEIIGTFW